MELTWIDDFLALERTGNFTRAAQERCTTQSAYSRRIQRLENWLGAKLLERESRPVTLTPAGEAFLPRARQIREEMMDARRATMSVASHFKRPLRIYTTNTLATSFVPQWIIENNHRNYALIVASIAGCLEAVRQKRADMALVPLFEGEVLSSPLKAQCIAEDALSFVAPTKGAVDIELKRRKLSGPILAYTPGTSYGAQIARRLAVCGIAIMEEPMCESASAEALLAQVKAGLGAAWIPRILLGEGLRAALPSGELDIPYGIALVTT